MLRPFANVVKSAQGKSRVEFKDYASLGIVFGLILSLPLAILIPLGAYVDKKIGSLPAFILVAFFASLAFSSFVLYRVISVLFRQE